MANGHDKNWIRLCGAMDGFFVRYGHWPTRVRLEQALFDDLRDRVFTKASWSKLERRIAPLVTEGAIFVAEDDSGRSYSYGSEGFPEQSPAQSAEHWLGVTPDRGQNDEREAHFGDIFERLFNEGDPSWWRDLGGEVRQGRPPGRYLEQTLADVMAKDYRKLPRHQLFFTNSKRSCMDGRHGPIGIEEKVIHLNFAGIRDGAICRSLVWVLGDPMAIGASIGALGLCVVKECPPLSIELGDALFRIIGEIRNVGVETVFVNGKDGTRWPARPGGIEPPPEWLAAPSAPSPFALPPFGNAEVAKAEALPTLCPTEPLFGSQPCWIAAPEDGEIAYAEWGNAWQMIDIGMILRARGFRAVKVKYTGEALALAGHGVEQRVQRGMRDFFGVVLDWGLAL